MKYLLIALFFSGCTDAQFSKIKQLGGAQHIKCYSGGVLIYEGNSTGKVMNEEKSDGYYFEDSQTQKVIEVSANCMFTGI